MGTADTVYYGGATPGSGTYTGPVTTSPATSTTPSVDPGGGSNASLADIKDWLTQFGFASATADQLAKWAWDQIVNGASTAEIKLNITEQPAFKQEFPEIDARRSAGLPYMSPAEVVDYRRKAMEAASAAGLPKSFYDNKDDFTKLITSNVSLSEYMDRVKAAQTAAYLIPADVRASLSGVLGIGDFTALAFDPTVAAPLLERKIKEAEAATAASRTGFGSLSEQQRGQVAESGLSFGKQQEAFTDLTNAQELFLDLSGSGTEGTVSRDEQISGTFAGNANAQRRIQQRAARRKAEFGGGSGYGASREGVSGLGTS